MMLDLAFHVATAVRFGRLVQIQKLMRRKVLFADDLNAAIQVSRSPSKCLGALPTVVGA